MLTIHSPLTATSLPSHKWKTQHHLRSPLLSSLCKCYFWEGKWGNGRGQERGLTNTTLHCDHTRHLHSQATEAMCTQDSINHAQLCSCTQGLGAVRKASGSSAGCKLLQPLQRKSPVTGRGARTCQGRSCGRGPRAPGSPLLLRQQGTFDLAGCDNGIVDAWRLRAWESWREGGVEIGVWSVSIPWYPGGSPNYPGVGYPRTRGTHHPTTKNTLAHHPSTSLFAVVGPCSLVHIVSILRIWA